MPASVLVIDQDAATLDLVTYHLRQAGYAVLTAQDGETGLAQAQAQAVDMVILEVELPGKDGFEVCRALRRGSLDLPIMLLTSRDSEIDRVVGFEVGVDDFVTKPFSLRELVGRVRAILRRATRKRGREQPQDQTIIGSLVIDMETKEVTCNGERIALTPFEFGLLSVMAQNRGKVFTRMELIRLVSGPESASDLRTVDVHIRNLRVKLEADPTVPSVIETVRGVGYRFSPGGPR